MGVLRIIIPNRMKNQRLDVALAEMLPNYSRSKITTWIKSGDALVNKKPFKPKEKAHGNEIISLVTSQKETTKWLPEKIPLNIVYEDDDIIIINKPFGLVTHPGAGNWSGTLANALLNYDKNLSKLDRSGIVHRLDKNTSGLMVVAKTIRSQNFLVEQLALHLVEREYSAIVYGNMISGGTIDEPIGRDPKDRIKQAISRNGKNAVTHYRVIDRFSNHTHVKAILETGRTHQIRVHLAYVGHPLIGDPLYGGRVRFPKNASQELKDLLTGFNRHALHSKKITLQHPETGNLMSWKVELPNDMKELIDRFKFVDS